MDSNPPLSAFSYCCIFTLQSPSIPHNVSMNTHDIQTSFSYTKPHICLIWTTATTHTLTTTTTLTTSSHIQPPAHYTVQAAMYACAHPDALVVTGKSTASTSCTLIHGGQHLRLALVVLSAVTTSVLTSMYRHALQLTPCSCGGGGGQWVMIVNNLDKMHKDLIINMKSVWFVLCTHIHPFQGS